MRVLKTVAVLASLVVLALAAGWLLPRKIRVERSIDVDAARPAVFELLDGPRSLRRFSPWGPRSDGERDVFDGPAVGVDARRTWRGSGSRARGGRETIVESVRPERVSVSIEIDGTPRAASRYVLTAQGRRTRVAWTVEVDLGRSPVSRLRGLGLERKLGPDYERSLKSLAALAESLPDDEFWTLPVEEVDVPAAIVARSSGTSAKDAEAIAKAVEEAYARVEAFVAANRLRRAGPPRSIKSRWDGATYDFEVAIPVEGASPAGAPAVATATIGRTYSGRALRTTHRGSYGGLPRVYERLFAWASARGFEVASAPWDEYVTDSRRTPDSDLVTVVCLPVK